jgi:hypothetical protein
MNTSGSQFLSVLEQTSEQVHKKKNFGGDKQTRESKLLNVLITGGALTSWCILQQQDFLKTNLG